MRTKRQNIQLELALEPAAKGEARSAGAQGTEARTARAEPERPAAGQQPSMEAVVEPGNLKKALARVRRNKGAPGVDGMTVDELGDHLKAHWPEIRSRLLAGSYTPQPVRRVEIPKASGGVRLLGVPTVLDRFIQQAGSPCRRPVPRCRAPPAAPRRPGGFPVAGEHHVGSRRAAAGELARQTHPSGVGGHAALEAGGRGRGRKPQPYHLRRERDHTISWRRSGGSAQRADGARGAVLEVADIAGLARLVRLAAADGDEDAVAGVLYVRPPQGGDFRPPQPAHEQQPGDHGVQTAALGGDPLRLNTIDMSTLFSFGAGVTADTDYAAQSSDPALVTAETTDERLVLTPGNSLPAGASSSLAVGAADGDPARATITVMAERAGELAEVEFTVEVEAAPLPAPALPPLAQMLLAMLLVRGATSAAHEGYQEFAAWEHAGAASADAPADPDLLRLRPSADGDPADRRTQDASGAVLHGSTSRELMRSTMSICARSDGSKCRTAAGRREDDHDDGTPFVGEADGEALHAGGARPYPG